MCALALATDYGVFPANHVQTIPVSPLDVKSKLQTGTTLVVQNASNMWRRVRVVEGPGIMSKQVKIHFIGYLKKWDGGSRPAAPPPLRTVRRRALPAPAPSHHGGCVSWRVMRDDCSPTLHSK